MGYSFRMPPLPQEIVPLLFITLLVAVLYSSVGHGGASGYLAAMALVGMSPATSKPTALMLNLLVAGLGSFRYAKAGDFSFRRFWPFATGSVPFAFLGGRTAAPDELYNRLLGLALVVAAAGMLWRGRKDRPLRPLPVPLALLIGAAVGYVSGLLGVGGGIFLSPILILLGWATTRQSLGVAAAFIFVNSAAALSGHWAGFHDVPGFAVYLALAALLGGIVGTHLGAKSLGVPGIRLALALVLCIAAGKLLLDQAGGAKPGTFEVDVSGRAGSV